ncbi:peptidase [Pseudomonas putida S11]|nr:peptidase [Pseudomonas putida S11]
MTLIRTKPWNCARRASSCRSSICWKPPWGVNPGARLLEAELEEDDNRYEYEVELLTAEGVVREIKLDASSGALLKDEEDD